MNLSPLSNWSLIALLATGVAHAQSAHQQVGNFATNAGINVDIQGVIRAPADGAGTVPAEEYVGVFTRFEELGYLAGGTGALDQYTVQSVDIVIGDEDEGNAGAGTENQFTMTFYAESTAAAPVNGAVLPDLATRQTVGPFILPNNGVPGTPALYYFNVALPAGGVNIQRSLTDGGGTTFDGSTFCGVSINAESDGNATTMAFLSGADLSTFGLAEFDLPNGVTDSASGATSCGHGLTGAIGGQPNCAGGYIYIDDPATANLDFFGPFACFISLLGEDSAFKVMVRTDQDGGVTANGNMPGSNAAPGTMSPFSSRRPVGASVPLDCSNTSGRLDELYFYYRDTRLPASTPMAIFLTFGPLPITAIDLDFVGWEGMVCFPATTTLTIRTGVTDANGEYFSPNPLSMVPINQSLTFTFTGIGLNVIGGNITLHAGKCERVII